MFRWYITIEYIEGYGDGYIMEHYYIIATDSVTALDTALTKFLADFGLDFDDVYESLEWDCCKMLMTEN